MSNNITMQIAKLLGIFSTGCILLNASTKVSNAAQFYNGWNYATDSFNDSISGNNVGGTVYEMYGLAMKQLDDQVIFAVNTNLPIEGTRSNFANDGHIGWGDLILNFSGLNLATASNNGNLFAIDFTGSDMGVYGNVTAKSIARENGNRLDNLGEYNSYVSQHGGNPSMGDLSAYDPYFDQNQHIQNVRASGTRIGDVTLLGADVLGNLGLDFGHFGANGSQLIAFSFQSSSLPTGDFIGYLDPECNNDGMAISSFFDEAKPTPEPSATLSLFAVAGFGFTAFRKRQKQIKAN
jgi:hypothetical protein